MVLCSSMFMLFSYPICSGSRSPGLAADMHFIDDVIAFIGPGLEEFARVFFRLLTNFLVPQHVPSRLNQLLDLQRFGIRQ